MPSAVTIGGHFCTTCLFDHPGPAGIFVHWDAACWAQDGLFGGQFAVANLAHKVTILALVYLTGWQD